jgi:hypothetical protein
VPPYFCSRRLGRLLDERSHYFRFRDKNGVTSRRQLLPNAQPSSVAPAAESSCRRWPQGTIGGSEFAALFMGAAKIEIVTSGGACH